MAMPGVCEKSCLLASDDSEDQRGASCMSDTCRIPVDYLSATFVGRGRKSAGSPSDDAGG